MQNKNKMLTLHRLQQNFTIMAKRKEAANTVKQKETISIQDGSIIIPIAFAVARYGGKAGLSEGERGGGITRTELAIIDAVLHKIQSLVRKRIDMQQNGMEDGQLLFQFEREAGKITDKSQSQYTDVGNYEFRFPLRDLGIAPRHYQEAFDVVMKMGDINVEWEFEDEKHGRSTTKKQLFQPTALGGVRRWNNPDAHRKPNGEVEPVPSNAPKNLFHWEYTGKPAVGISMSGIVADRIFDPYRYGHYLDITLDFKCKYSIRLYWFLSLYWSRGFTTFDFSWHALRTTLGIDQNPEGGRNIIQELPDSHSVRINAPDAPHIVAGVYPKLSLFISRVLDPIREDFLRMAPKPAKDGEPSVPPPRVEYNLNYDVKKRTDTSRGTRVEVADRIIITLNVSSLGEQIQAGRDINAQQRRVIDKMTDKLCQKPDKARFFARTASGQLQLLEKKVDYLVEGITTRNPKWKICQELDRIEEAYETALASAETDYRRQRAKEDRDHAMTKAIRNSAFRSLDNFCKTEILSDFTVAQEVVDPVSCGETQDSPLGITGDVLSSFAAMKEELIKARTGHLCEEPKHFENLMQHLRPSKIEGDKHIIWLKCFDGSTFTRDGAVQHYWEPDKFDEIFAKHFPGYVWMPEY